MNDLSVYLLFVWLAAGLKLILVLGSLFVIFINLALWLSDFTGKFSKWNFWLIIPFVLGCLIPSEKYLVLIGISEFGETFLQSEVVSKILEKILGE